MLHIIKNVIRRNGLHAGGIAGFGEDTGFVFFALAGAAGKALRLDQVQLPNSDFAHYAGQSLAFPLNPHAGYIDGSIYLDGAHHRVDVSKITFGTKTIDGLEIEIEAQRIFEFEGLGPYRNTPWTLNSLLRADP